MGQIGEGSVRLPEEKDLLITGRFFEVSNGSAAQSLRDLIAERKHSKFYTGRICWVDRSSPAIVRIA